MALILTKVRNRFLFRILQSDLSKYSFLIVLFFSFHFSTFAQTKVEIIGGERMYGNQIKNYLYIVKNVVIRHNGVTIQCDSAIRKIDEGVIEGFGNIFIYQPDTFTLSGGDYLLYDEATKTAKVNGKSVILKDQQMTLLTTSLSYNVQNQVGYYTNGADILNENNRLKSKRGYYNRRINTFNFKDQVVLTSPEYTMKSDTLDYFSMTKTAYFFGPTRIVSAENTIVCNYGWYNTKTEKAQFSKGATIYSDSNFISADSLIYDKKIGKGLGIGNIHLYDSTEHFEVFGQNGEYYQNKKLSIISGNPLAIKTEPKDTFYLMADSLYFSNDTSNRYLRAFHHTSISQRDFKGICDSLIYNFKDSSIHLYHSPILWSSKNQITGDTMRIYIQNGSIKTLIVNGNSFLASEIKSETYNQIAGKKMINQFEKNKLKSVLVSGNAESIYYIRNNETDTAEYTGVNKVSCGKMKIGFDTSKVNSIRFYAEPDGKMYPVKDFPETEKFLSGLKWRTNLQPLIEDFLKRKEKRPAPRKEPTKVLPQLKKAKKKKK
jgi:lipopolysaccharide export system protein LptA